jgi:GT2 family glycosyltransferase
VRDLVIEWEQHPRERRLSVRCSIVIPCHGRAGLTRQCIDALLGEPPATAFELIVVDDASPDDDALTVIGRERNAGFATACNDGAAAAKGEYLVFLNNDTIPRKGWLDALVAVADKDPQVAVVGSKLLFPNDTVQHAGVVVCQDGNPRHLYAGFPAEHPAVNKARRFQAVTAASMLVRRTAFERAGGFDVEFRNCLEDTDLCMRLGELGYEVRYCPESVLQHLESVSRGRRSSEIAANTRLFKERWGERAERDDLRYYLEDGLLRLRYRDAYPIRIELAPELAVAADLASGRFMELQSHQVADLLRETVRLTAHVADLDVRPPQADAERTAGAPDRDGIEGLVAEAERLQLDIHAFQERIAEALSGDARGNGRPGFAPGEGLAYLDLKERIRPVVEATVPPGAIMLVVSRGDDSLVELPEREGWHFPREADGAYAGRHPVDSDEAIAELEKLRAEGAQYLVIPAGDAWWLDHYEDFARHLEERYDALTHAGAPCRVFRL